MADPIVDVWEQDGTVLLRTSASESMRELVDGAETLLIAVSPGTGRSIVNLVAADETVLFSAELSRDASQAYPLAPRSAVLSFDFEADAVCEGAPCLPPTDAAGQARYVVEVGSWSTILAVRGIVAGQEFGTEIHLDPAGEPTAMLPSGGPLTLNDQNALNVAAEVLTESGHFGGYLDASHADPSPVGGSYGCEFGRYTALTGLGILWGACCVATIETVVGCVVCTGGANEAKNAIQEYDCGG